MSDLSVFDRAGNTAIGIRIVTGLAAAIALASCQHASRSDETLSVAEATKPQTPLQYGKAVANWQLAAFDDLSYLPTFIADSAHERGWVKAAFYIGLDRYARQAEDKALYGVLERVSRGNGFDLGRQPWHADDQAIAAVYAPRGRADGEA